MSHSPRTERGLEACPGTAFLLVSPPPPPRPIRDNAHQNRAHERYTA